MNKGYLFVTNHGILVILSYQNYFPNGKRQLLLVVNIKENSLSHSDLILVDELQLQ
jgi:hypothetical protein